MSKPIVVIEGTQRLPDEWDSMTEEERAVWLAPSRTLKALAEELSYALEPGDIIERDDEEGDWTTEPRLSTLRSALAERGLSIIETDEGYQVHGPTGAA